MSYVYVARQPIYTSKLDVFAYELLYRSGDENAARFTDGDQATSAVISNSLTEIGLENLVGNRPAFINLTRGFLTGDLLVPLPNDRVVFEVLEDVMVDDEVLAAVKALSRQGYTIALDDFVWSPEKAPLVRLADIVKLDVMALGCDGIAEHVAVLEPFGVQLLAEKVETAEEFELCKSLGISYFQGYHFSKPAIVRQRQVPPNKMAMIQLLGELQHPDVTMQSLEEMISRDVALSYKILRYINSAYVNLPQPIESIHRGIVYMGLSTIRRWATLLVLARAEDKPTELMVTAMVRAKMCETLAASDGSATPDASFTAGLFSVLDALLDLPMDEVVAQLALGPEIERALMDRHGPVGEILACTLAYERGDWAAARCNTLPPESVADAYLIAVNWTNEALGAVVT